MAIIRTQWETATNKDLLKVGTLRKIFDTTVRKARRVSERLFRMETTAQWEETETRLAGLDQADEIAEGQNIPIQSPQRGGDKTYTQRIFGTGFRMTYAMDWANKYNLFKRWTANLGRVMVESKDIELAVLWNNPTSITLTCGVGYDSLALANDAHTGLLPGSTADNYDNYGNAALSYTSIKTMRYYFKTLTDDMGMWMGLEPDTLYFEPTLWPTVTEFFGATGKPGTFSNDINLVPKMGISPYEYPRLSSATAWGVCASKSDLYDVKCRTGLAPKFFTKDAPDSTQDKLIVAMQFFTYGWGDARAVWIGKT